MRRLSRLAWVVLVLALLALIGRIVAVRAGVLYGATAVTRMDRIIAGAVGLGLAAASAAAVRRAARRSNGKDDKPFTFVDGVAVLTAIGSVVAVLVSGVNLFVPVDYVGQATSTCAGARTRGAEYVGVTTGPDGDNTRVGPGRSFPANGRFAKDCSVGFSAYCLGDPIEDSAGTIKGNQRWLTSRWLLVAKQKPGLRSWLARVLSGEKPGNQFVTDANIAPATSYENLPLAPATACGASYPVPGKAILQIYDPGNHSLTATSQHAVNIGFATWKPRGQGFQDEDVYQPIYNSGFPADANPGATSADGKKSVAWAYIGSLQANLRANRRGGPSAPALVVVMAIPCISDNLPADPATAATATYDISGQVPKRQGHPLKGFDPARLAHAACQANT